MSTVFQKIIDREISAEIVFEDDLCIAFKDVNAQAPTHVLLIPKKPIPTLDDLTQEDQNLLGHMMLHIPKIADQLKLDQGYRVVINCKAYGGQTVFHLHIHILGGRPLKWPPG